MTEPGGTPAPGLIPRPLAIAMTIVAMSVWVLDAVAAVFIAGYMANPTITTTFVTIASVILGLGRGKADPAPRPPPPDPPPQPPPPPPPDAPAAAVLSVAELAARLRAEQPGAPARPSRRARPELREP